MSVRVGGTVGGIGASPATPLAVMIVVALIGLVLIGSAELAPEGSSNQTGPYGYLLLQLAGALGLWAHHGRGPGVAWAAGAMVVLFLVNMLLFLAIDLGLLGPQIVLIAFDLVLLFISGIVGGLAVLRALLWTASGAPRPPIGPAVTVALVAAILVGRAVAEAEPGPGPTPTFPPGSSSATPTVGPTLTATPTAPSPRTFPLVVKIEGNGSVLLRAQNVTCRSTCSYSLPEGTVATLTAQPGTDSVFSTWAGCRTTCQVLMDRAREVSATFRFPTLHVSIEGKDRGTVRSEPKGIACPPTCEAPFGRGTRVTLAATPGGSAAFTGWSEGCGGFGACALEIKTDSAATAQFETLAGPGYDARECSEFARVQVRRGETATLGTCFVNVGTVTWIRGTGTEVELAQCCPLGGPSPLSGWAVRWSSDHVYADLPVASVAPGQSVNAFFSIRAPANATFGDHRFDGILVRASTGAPIAGGAFSIVVTVVR